MIGWVGEKEGSLRYEFAQKTFGTLEEVPSIKDLWGSSEYQHLSMVLLSEMEYSQSIKDLPFRPEELMMTGFCDGFINQKSSWLPRCSYLEVFTQRLARQADSVDLSKGVLLVGDFVPARAALAALFKLGYKDFFILGESDKLINSEVRRHFFGITVKTIQVQDLINLSGEASVLLHGVRKEENIIGEWELSYLNFLGRPGLLIDFLDDGFIGKVVNETQDEGLLLIGGREIEQMSMEWWKKKTV